MIDIHTHLVPFVDDGAKTIEEAIENIKRVISQGVTMAFCTPHYQLQSNFEHDADKLRAQFTLIEQKVNELNLDIRLLLGSELYYHRKIIDDVKTGKAMTMGKTNIVLLEFSMVNEVEEMNEVLYNFRIAGYQVILAHPERYEYINNMRDYQDLKREGVKFQVNASSIVGNHGKHAKKWAWHLLDSGMVDYIASDTHAHRPNDYLEARKQILKKYGENIERSLFVHNPMKLVIAAREAQ